MEVLAGGEAGGNGRFGEEVEDKTVWHGNYQIWVVSSGTQT